MGIELSAQQVTSCTPNLSQCGGTGGCYGSVTELGFNYLQLFGHVLEADYPYVSGTTTNSEECNYDLNSVTPAVAISGYETISINHGIQLVGYGSEFSPLGVYDYWLVRNSWGASWGEDGYIKLLRTPACGVNSTHMDGTACVGGPGNDQQTVCGMCGMLMDSSYPLGVRKF